ncbi:MAG TPA: hypothetical protein VD969_04810 [Symbiobacteriaceae bacterium]|nr:hypothetical protein [Symbiobacteriaceae bacterium]
MVDLLAVKLIERGLTSARLAEIMDVVGPVVPMPTTFLLSLITSQRRSTSGLEPPRRSWRRSIPTP